MFDRLSRSWQLVKASGSVLRQDRQLLLFPLISGIAVVFVLLCFALPLFGMGAFDGLSERQHSANSYAVAFLFYLAQYFVIFFFNAALVGAAMIRLDGGTPTVGDGLRIASSKFATILGYACIAATVGLVLRLIQERVGFVGRIVVAILGAGWSLATYLVVPVLVATDVGPIQAVQDSTSLLKRTWGETIIGQGGLGLAFALIYIAVLASGAMLFVAVATFAPSALLLVVVGLIALASFMLTALVHSALSGIYAAALYRYASNSDSTPGFDSQILEMAFVPAKS